MPLRGSSSRGGSVVAAAALLALASPGARAFYIPGAFPNVFAPNATLHMRVNALTSDVAELRHDYYSLPFCRPPGGPRRVAENLGEVLAGDRIATSAYAARLVAPGTADEPPALLCQTRLSAADADGLRQRIDEGYRANMLLDTLPVTTSELLPNGGRGEVAIGFPIGFKAPASGARSQVTAHDSHTPHAHHDDAYYVYNHLSFRVLLHRAEAGLPRQPSLAAAAGMGDAAVLNEPTVAKHDDPGWLIVGFEVEPCSVARESMGGLPPYDASADREAASDQPSATPRLSHPVVCTPGGAHARVVAGETLVFSYSVRFEISSIEWNQRWDAYLRSGSSDEVHWFSILNSTLLVLALGALIALILARAVRHDLLKLELNLDVPAAEAPEDAGWKLLRSDAFRAPEAAEWLAVAAGSGAQVLCVAVATAVLAALGFASPASRGAALTSAMLLYPLSAGVGGFAAVRVLAWASAGSGAPGSPPGSVAAAAAAHGWRAASLRTATLLPGFAAACAAMVNAAVHHAGGDASGAVPLSLFAALFALWALVSLPLALVGGYIASRQPPPVAPCRATAVARHVPIGAPSLAWTALAGGALPFGAAFVELHFALGALWQQRAYYAPGFALLALLLTCALAAEAAAVLTYAALNAEEHRWWWRAFVAGGAPALYAAAYVALYAAMGPLNLVGIAGITMYVLYSAVVLAAAFCAGGVLGLAASLALVNHLFAAIKGD